MIKFLAKNEHRHEININILNDAKIISRSTYYPNILFSTINSIVNPIREVTMSLMNSNQNIELNDVEITNTELGDMFFFIYNTDNYYHFIYDTLPYLITFLELRKNNPGIKLLMNYPNPGSNKHYKFVLDFLKILGITEDNISIIREDTLYKKIFVSDSFTHGPKINCPPRKEVYELFNKLKINTQLDKKIYISRRSWIHGDTSNIGTNYTTRRRMENENELVEFLISRGYEETFTELLSAEEKLVLFGRAKEIVGAIGGGMCNALFANENCKILTIVSPTFLDVNQRFIYSLNNSKLFYDTYHTEDSEFKKYMRVKADDIIGEIIDIDGDILTLAYSTAKIAGWSHNVSYHTIKKHSNECTKLDNGLNSSWKIDLDKFKIAHDKLCSL